MATNIGNNPVFKLTPHMLTLPVKVSEYFQLSLIFLLLGFFISCWFLLYNLF